MAENLTETLAERGRKRRPRATTSTGIVVVGSSVQPYELRKATEALTVRNRSSGDISFLSRKAYNVMLQIAQETIEAKGDENLVTFTATLREFERRVGHTTPNGREYLKQMLRALASIQVEFDYVSTKPSAKREPARNWGVANMVSEVYIDEDTATLRWSFPPELKKKMLDPEIYNLIDLRTQMLFTSHSALALYEICSRYFTKPSLKTFQDHWTGWSTLLSGSREPHKSFREFNKMLNRALEQVRAVAPEYEITPLITKSGRAYNLLSFAIKPIPQQSLLSAAQPVAISLELERKMSQLGLPKEDVAVLMGKFDEEYLLAQADYTLLRVKNNKKSVVENVTGFYMKAVEQNYAKTPVRPRDDLALTAGSDDEDDGVINVEMREVEPEAAKKSALDSQLDTLKQQWRAAKHAEIRDELLAKSADERLAIASLLEEELQASSDVIWRLYQKKGLGAPSVERHIVDMLFKQKYPSDPDAQELLMFSLRAK